MLKVVELGIDLLRIFRAHRKANRELGDLRRQDAEHRRIAGEAPDSDPAPKHGIQNYSGYTGGSRQGLTK